VNLNEFDRCHVACLTLSRPCGKKAEPQTWHVKEGALINKLHPASMSTFANHAPADALNNLEHKYD
jgi:hypothetical protein